ncbi:MULTISPECIES: alpha/beta hydrolase [Candidatus Ichthyocystis]|uniref:Putative phospholipase/carboxylesterase n=1 Tax=Candidatus Ichthyocystis hellenicum TaxID=1561003 RepID=A0A0S4M4X3_9BURK|nr:MULTISPECIES: hypothetical protein [Ichthyocystis]CUT18028.1 putative phospholipase/carboxylesterase [Candidatus Ichthyocystis hellenicum]
MTDERVLGDCVIRSWGDNPLILIILLHGLGDNAENLMFLGEALYSARYGSKVIALNAPYKSIPYFSGEVMRSWFNLSLSWDIGIGDADGLAASCQRVLDVIEDAIKKDNFSERNIFLGGFSQGGIVCLMLSIMMKRQIGGIFSLSSMLRDIDLPSDDIVQKNIDTPIFFAEGLRDEIIPEDVRRVTENVLASLFPDRLTYNKYDIGHNLAKEEIDDLREWIHEKIKFPQ